MALAALQQALRASDAPFVTLSYAQSVDGSIAGEPGRPLRLSGDASMALTHGIRAAHDLIVVGIGTVLSDNPSLTVRLVEGDSPQPVVVDSRLRLPMDCKLAQRAPILLAGPAPDEQRAAALEERGARVLRCAAGPDGRGVDLADGFAQLWALGYRSAMVEGGAGIITSLLRQPALVSRVVVTVAPVFVGGVRCMSGLAAAPVRMEGVVSEQFGEDVVVSGSLVVSGVGVSGVGVSGVGVGGSAASGSAALGSPAE